MLKLVGTDGTRFYSWQLSPGEYSLGRGKDADFVVPDGTVSRTHAIIRADADGQKCTVIDQGSHNGTVVNGERISEPVEVREGDRTPPRGARPARTAGAE